MDWVKAVFVISVIAVVSLGAIVLAQGEGVQASPSHAAQSLPLFEAIRGGAQTVIRNPGDALAAIGEAAASMSTDFQRAASMRVEAQRPVAATPAPHLEASLELVSRSRGAGELAGEVQPLQAAADEGLAQGAAAGPGPGDCSQPYQSMDWLDLLNDFRSLADLPPVSENPEWSYGDCLHSRYLVKNDEVGHEEDPENPWYTPEGAEAGIYSNVLGWAPSVTDEAAIASWMETVYHGIWMVNPGLREVGFGSYREYDGGLEMAAALDVIRGIRAAPDSVRFPVMFPGDGKHMPIRDFGGGETPNPLVNCPGYSYPTGPSLFLRYQTTPTLHSHELRRDGSPVDACAFVEGDAVVLLPREPLISATYQVSVQSSEGAHSWSFYFGSAGCFPSTPGACGGGNIDALHTADRAFDDATETYFQASYDEDAWDLYFNYGAPVSMQRVELDYFDERFIAAHTELNVSRDGVNWVTIGEFSPSDPTSLSVGGAYQYLWLAMQGKNPQSGYTPAIREVNVLSGSSPPTIAQPAAAEPSPVYGDQATLTVLGQDDGGEANLSYTWEAISGPLGVSFTPNGDNAAKRTLATFPEAGVYRLQVTVRDRDGLGATSAVDLEVFGPECDQEVVADRWQGEYWVFEGDLPAQPGAPYQSENRWGARRIREDISSRYGLGDFLDVDFDAHGGGPNRCQVGTDRFFTWFRRTADFQAGEYVFTAGSDDAIKVWVNDGGWQALEECTFWDLRPFREQSCTHIFKGPGRYEIAAAYFENDGGAHVRLTWEGVGLPTATSTTRPSSTPTATATSRPPDTHTPTPTATLRPPDTDTPTPEPTQVSGTVVQPVTSGEDDTYAYMQYYRWVNGVSEPLMILDSGNWGGLRFENIRIPQGAKIESAYLEIRIDYRDDPAAYIYSQASDSAPDFSDQGPQGRPRGSSYVRWQASDVGQGWVDTPDLKDLVQEVVDRSGWRSGNAIVFLWWPTSGSRLRVRQWDYDSGGSAARLYVQYQGSDTDLPTNTPQPTEEPSNTPAPTETPRRTSTPTGESTPTHTATSRPESTCPLPAEHWAGLAEEGSTQMGALLPIWLGSEGGRTSYQVRYLSVAERFLRMEVGDQFNGISMLYAELLAAKLNLSSGVPPGNIEGTILEADEFLAAHTYHDWSYLTRADRYQVLDRVEELRGFNQGDGTNCAVR